MESNPKGRRVAAPKRLSVEQLEAVDTVIVMAKAIDRYKDGQTVADITMCGVRAALVLLGYPDHIADDIRELLCVESMS
jgi:hypothetical protein